MSESTEPKIENSFMEIMREIGREVALLDATRTELDKDLKLKSLDLVEQIEKEADAEQKQLLIKELGRTLAQFDATKSELDRDAKLKALRLIDELQK